VAPSGSPRGAPPAHDCEHLPIQIPRAGAPTYCACRGHRRKGNVMLQQADVKPTGHTPTHWIAAVAGLGELERTLVARGTASPERRRGPVIRTLIVSVGLVGFLLTATPHVTDGSASQDAQVGVASWYGKRHQGRKTASGERFSRGSFTAAHRSLPLGPRSRSLTCGRSSRWSSPSRIEGPTGAAGSASSTSPRRQPHAWDCYSTAPNGCRSWWSSPPRRFHLAPGGTAWSTSPC